MSSGLVPELDSGQTLWEDTGRALRLVVSPEPQPAFIELLEQTRFGSSGLRYRRLDVAGQLAALPRPWFIALLRGDRLIGTYALARVVLRTEAGFCEGIYRAALSVDEREQGRGFGKLIVTRTLAWLDDWAATNRQPLISYGCIEHANQRSLGLLRATGASQLGTLNTQLVYKQWPRRKMELLRLNPVADPWIADIQQAAEADCVLTMEPPSTGCFFACTDSSGVAAGAFARLIRLDLERMGAPWDFLSEHVFARIGPARRRFDPRNFTYLKLDSPVFGEGGARAWPDFLSTLLAEHGTHMAMITLDPGRAANALLQSAGIFSRFSRVTRQQLSVVVSGHQVQAAELSVYAGRPLALVPVDI